MAPSEIGPTFGRAGGHWNSILIAGPKLDPYEGSGSFELADHGILEKHKDGNVASSQRTAFAAASRI